MKESSLRVYEGGDTYETWEFIWNPQTQVAISRPGYESTGTYRADYRPGRAI